MNKNSSGYYLYDLKEKENMHLYYGLKNRFEYKVENRLNIINKISESIKSVISEYDFVIYPESSSSFLSDILNPFGCLKIEVKKNSIDKIIEYSNNLKLQKKERESHHEKFLIMKDKFKINLMKSNQRRYYESVIFENTTVPAGKGLIIDDSHFSGTTLNALRKIVGNLDFLAIFSK